MVTLVGCEASPSPWGHFLFRSTPISEGVSSSVILKDPQECLQQCNSPEPQQNLWDKGLPQQLLQPSLNDCVDLP